MGPLAFRLRRNEILPRLTYPSNENNAAELNDELSIVAAIFPNVRPEVFREMLSSFSEESRLHVVTEQLLKHPGQWVKGRWRVSLSSSKILKEVFEVEQTPDEIAVEKELVPVEEAFRSKEYKRAVKAALSHEFKTLSRSTIDGVLAEQNHSYSLSRPILLGLVSKSWRLNFSALLSRWKRTPNEGHYMLIGKGHHLRETNSAELNEELYATVLKPLLDQQQETQQLISLELATLLNEQEAESVGATYECEVCLSDSTFEAVAICSEGTHVICFTCVQRSVSEALYGQSWGLNIDHDRSQVACVAPTDVRCSGCIPDELARRAILQTRGGSKTLEKLQSRFAEESLRSSGATFVRCPFCTYAELDDLYLPPGTLRYRFNDSHPYKTVLLISLSLCLILFIPQYFFFSSILSIPRPKVLISNSIHALIRRTHLPSRFYCRNPECMRPSCRLCKVAWRDPHTCFESAALSLRTTVEAARTAALKRTCPRCGLAFVKESGCNKMVCVCGYSMCYICRQGLGRKQAALMNPARGEIHPRLVPGDEEDAGEGEGYRHFCQHFRPAGGRCHECEKCDLYRAEDEDQIVKKAGERAEKDWRKHQGVSKGVYHAESQGRLQETADWWIGMILKC